MMEYNVLDSTLAQLEARLSREQEATRIEPLLALAWYLRQRDCQRVLGLCEEIQALLTCTDLAQTRHRAITLRLMLIQAEIHWLYGRMENAAALAALAIEGFTALADALGCADAHMLKAWLAFDQGALELRDSELALALQYARQADPQRAIIFEARLAMTQVYRSLDNVKSSWIGHFANLTPAPTPQTNCWIDFLLGSLANLEGEPDQAIRYFDQAHTLALASGQLRMAIITATEIGAAFTQLNEYHTALDWMQVGMDLARTCGWNAMLGTVLYQTAGTLQRLQRHESALSLLQEALTLMKPMTGSHAYAQALHYLGEAELGCAEYEDALNTFRMVDMYAVELKHPRLHPIAMRGKAHALSELDQPLAALWAAHASLEDAKGQASEQIATLKVLADLHARHSLPAPAEMQAPSITLHYLLKALDLANTIEGYTVPGDWLDTMAAEYAKVGQYAKAYEMARNANLAREKTHNQKAIKRASAIQINYRNQRMRIEGEYHRQMAQAEAERVSALQQSSHTLTELSAIGQEITSELDSERICAVLKRHLGQILPADWFAIYLINASGSCLELAFGAEPDYAEPDIAMSDSSNLLVRCAREQRPLLCEPQDMPTGRTGPGLAGSRFFVPLCPAEQVLGVMTIQSHRAKMYGTREQSIFRTLASYTAIALANAQTHAELSQAHRDLQQTRQQQALQDKMAGLGSLTAGVAHEINNPSNFVHVAAQNMLVDLDHFEYFLLQQIEEDDTQEVIDLFATRFKRLRSHLTTMLNGTERIKGIVQDLRRFTRLDEALKKAIPLSECLVSTLNLVRTSWLEQVEFITEISDDPAVECWPALLNQACMNLLLNGCQAIAKKRGQNAMRAQRGKLWLRLYRKDQTMCIEFEDSGIGIPAGMQAHIMQPFYTVGKGTGLGLSIANDIIKKHGGHLHFISRAGIGSCFTIELPLSATASQGSHLIAGKLSTTSKEPSA